MDNIRTVVVTVVKTITLRGSEYKSMSDEQIVAEFQDSIETSSLDDWNWDDESGAVKIFQTKDIVLGE